jgi:antitoxin (DNA-binding transcriptional repressor) of toxin-antitoxin stability system
MISFQLLSPAEHGEEIVITKLGKPVALAMQAKG